MASMQPAYIHTHEQGKLNQKIEQAFELMKTGVVCPRKCDVNRYSEALNPEKKRGICKTGRYAFVSSYHAHFGEESPLVGKNGSGTIFFTHCNLMCNFCQNYDISHQGQGGEVMPDQLAYMMLSLQSDRCHNINFVTPTHVVPQILEALVIAVEKGLKIPLVYNSSGYDSVETL